MVLFHHRIIGYTRNFVFAIRDVSPETFDVSELEEDSRCTSYFARRTHMSNNNDDNSSKDELRLNDEMHTKADRRREEGEVACYCLVLV